MAFSIRLGIEWVFIKLNLFFSMFFFRYVVRGFFIYTFYIGFVYVIIVKIV